ELGRMSEDREILAGWLEGADLPEIPADLLAAVACCRGDQLTEAADKIGVILGDAFADDDTNRQDAYERLVARGQRDAEEAAA
ncbi:MAG TPA: hypothetical protein VLZ56_05785, partial [Mycoplana sp.]|nr:hypothetical protein [Mycoplana sp.]